MAVQQRAGGAAVAEMYPIPAKPFDDGVAQVVGASTPGVAHQPVAVRFARPYVAAEVAERLSHLAGNVEVAGASWGSTACHW